MTVKPTLEEIKKQYKGFKTVPICTELTADITAVEVLKRLKKISSHCYMLESAEDGEIMAVKHRDMDIYGLQFHLPLKQTA